MSGIKVKFVRTVSFNGNFYLRGNEYILSDLDARSLVGYYETNRVKPRAAVVAVAPQNTAMDSAEGAVVTTPTKPKKGGKKKGKGGKAKKGGKK